MITAHTSGDTIPCKMTGVTWCRTTGVTLQGVVSPEYPDLTYPIKSPKPRILSVGKCRVCTERVSDTLDFKYLSLKRIGPQFSLKRIGPHVLGPLARDDVVPRYSYDETKESTPVP